MSSFKRRPASVVLAGISAALTLGAGSPLAVSQVSFSRPAIYPTGDTPSAVAIADLNRDGRPDLVATNNFGNSVSVLMNNGGGRYRPKRDYRTGGGPEAVAIGDVNGDGKPDVVTANDDADSISVLLGRRDGRLGAKHDFRSGSGPLSVALADLNGDHKLDVVTANFGDYTVSVHLNDGKGGFQSRRSYPVTEAWSVATADLNGDGKQDVVVENVTGVSVLMNTGDGSLAGQSYTTEERSYSVAVGDLNGDKKPDVVTANADGDAVSVLLNDGKGTLERAHRYRTGKTSSSVAIADLNRDGRSDVVGASGGLDSLSVLLNRAGGGFGSPRSFRTGGSPGSLAIGDLNGDRLPDLVSTSEGDSVAVLLNTTGAPAKPRRAHAPRPRGTLVFASNRSGHLELYSIRADGSRLGQLTRNRFTDTAPVFSPDGRRIAFVRDYHLWLMNADGSGQRKMADNADGGFAWSPDSRRIAYLAPYVEAKGGNPLVTVSLDGRRRVVVPGGRNSGPSWSPDGKHIAFVREVGYRDDLLVVGANGSGLTTIRRNVGGAPVWSPRGDLIAFSGGKRGLLLIKSDGRGLRRVAWKSEAFAWSPNGRRIGFVVGGRLYVVSSAGGRVRDVTPNGFGRLSSPAWSPDGRWFVVLSVPLGAGTNDGDLLVVAADGSASRRLAVGFSYPYGADYRTPMWRPHGATRARLGGPPVPLSPSETVTAATLKTVGAIDGLAADGGRVALSVAPTESDCAHVSVWAPGTRPIHFETQEPCGREYYEDEVYGAIALAGTRAAWVEASTSGNSRETSAVLTTATTAKPTGTARIASWTSFGDGSDGPPHGAYVGSVHGNGDLLIFNTWHGCVIRPESDCKPTGQTWHGFEVSGQQLWRLGGSKPVEVLSGSGSFVATDVDAGRVVVVELGGAVDVVRATDGGLARRFVLPAGVASSAQLSGSQLVVLTATGLQAYDVATGASAGAVPLAPSAGRTLVDYDKGLAVYLEARTVHVVRIADGHQTTVVLPGTGHVFAQLQPAGLFTAYTLGRGDRPGRVDFIARAKLERRLR
jgi:Tol biopolymer transport system component